MPPLDFEYYTGRPQCAWCGSTGTHKPGCKALDRGVERKLSRNYVESSLTVQRKMTAQLRDEMEAMSENVLRGVAVSDDSRKDTRTEVQKRFDAIAEELDDGESPK